jgi:hypothetical protein
VASSAEFNIWNPCDTIFLDISMAKVAVQFSDFFMVNVIETDGLINGCTSKDRKDRKNKRFRLDSEAVARRRITATATRKPIFFFIFSVYSQA